MRLRKRAKYIRPLCCICIIFILLSCFTPLSAVAGWRTTNGSIVVYITNRGSKYHESDCGYLWNSKRSISLLDAVKKGYDPCSRCDPPIYTGIIPTEATEPPERETQKATSFGSSGKTSNSNSKNNNNSSKTSKRETTDFADLFFTILFVLLTCIYPTSKLIPFCKADGCLPVLIIHSCISGTALTALGWASWDWNKRYFLVTTSCCLLIFTTVCAICRSLDAKKIAEKEKEQARIEAERQKALLQKVIAKKENFQGELQQLKSKLSQFSDECAALTTNLSENTKHIQLRLDRILDEHKAVLNHEHKICTTNDGRHYGDSCTIYFRPHSSCYHLSSCSYRGTEYTHILTPPHNMRPCSYCKPDIIDTDWMQECTALYADLQKLQQYEKAVPFTPVQLSLLRDIVVNFCYTVENFCITSEKVYYPCKPQVPFLLRLKESICEHAKNGRFTQLEQQQLFCLVDNIYGTNLAQEMTDFQFKESQQSYLMTAANGMQVWVPADKLEAWEAAQADQSEEALKRRELMTSKILERMEQIKQDHLK